MTSPALSADVVAQMVAELTEKVDEARNDFATDTVDAEDTGERPDLWHYEISLAVEATATIRDMLTTLAAENATLRASEAAAMERVKVLEAVAAKLLAADKLREAYHAKPNDHNRIGDKKSPKHVAKTHWLRAFNRAVASARALTPTADKEPKT